MIGIFNVARLSITNQYDAPVKTGQGILKKGADIK
jgi:hypothetical protein